MAINASYQQIREQLINLSVDLEDKSKVCKILEQKSKDERNLLGLIEAGYEEKYHLIIENEVLRHQEQADKLAEDVSKLIEKKKDLVESCRILIESLKEIETEASSHGRQTHYEIEAKIEQEKKKFRSGQEDRLQKYLVGKAGEVRDITAKAMSSDLKRIDVSHEQDLLDLERKYKTEERKYREAMRSRLGEMVEAEERAVREAAKRSLKSRGETIESELQSMEREHRQRLRELTADDDAEAEKMRLELSGQVDSERVRADREISQIHDEWKSRLRDTERANANELVSMQKDYSEQLKRLRFQAVEERNELQTRIRSEVEREESDPGSGAQSSRSNKGDGTTSTSREGRGRGSGQDEGGTSDRGRGQVPCKDLGSERKSREEDFSARDDRGDKAETVDVDFVAQEERDKRIQSAIRQLQLDAVKQERAMKAKIADEKAFSLAARNRELEASQRKQRSLTEEISQHALEKEELVADLREQSARTAKLSDDLRDIRREMEELESGIETQIMRAREAEERTDRLTNTRRQAQLNKEREVKSQLKGLEVQEEEAAAACREEIERRERDRDRCLDELDRQIKSDVALRDSELDRLQENVHAEKTKAARLETIIRKRNNPPTALGPGPGPGPGTVSEGAGARPLAASGSTNSASPVPRDAFRVKATTNGARTGAGVGSGGRGREAK